MSSAIPTWPRDFDGAVSEEVKKLRDQLARIEAEQDAERRRAADEHMQLMLRLRIKEQGHEPCA